MERMVERAGVWVIFAILAIVVVVYSLWGAAIIKVQRQGNAFSQTNSASFTANF